MDRKKAIEIVRMCCPKIVDSKCAFETAMRVLVPELKEMEDEDERIRKELLTYLEHEYLVDKTIKCSEYNKYTTWLEKQGKQKPTKIEPKFKVGDWVINTITKKVEQVIDITDSEYICSGTMIVSFNNQHILKRWSIQDAKDGDVLCYKDEISLYKHDIKNCTKQETTFGGFVYHCCYDGERFITDSLYSITEQDKMDIHPATEEQRDLLFQKMKEAGYEWDSNKKEFVSLQYIFMKESLIEEKAKRYDEAIAKGRQIQNTPYTAHWDTMKEVVEHLFPELKLTKE